MKILVIGGSGLLGRRFIFFPVDHVLYFTYLYSPLEIKNAFKLDIKNKEEIQKLLRRLRPDVVVHTAAYSNVDGCEKNKIEAYNVNLRGTVNVAEATEEIGAKLIFISTDYVFDGLKGLYKEYDKCDPVNYYGHTKLLGEQNVRNICTDWIIARTSVIYGIEKENFVTWIVNNLKQGKNTNIVTDQFISPTFNLDLVEQLFALIENDKVGIFHNAGRERISRYDFSLVIADIFGLDKNMINSVRMEDIKWAARRPMDSSLDVSKVSRYKKPYKIKDAIALLKEELIRRG